MASGFKRREIATNNLVPSADMAHKDFGDMAELLDSIRQNGIKQPLVVRPIGSGNYQVIAGSRRFVCAKELGIETVPVVIQQITDLINVRVVEGGLLDDSSGIEATDDEPLDQVTVLQLPVPDKILREASQSKEYYKVERMEYADEDDDAIVIQYGMGSSPGEVPEEQSSYRLWMDTAENSPALHPNLGSGAACDTTDVVKILKGAGLDVLIDLQRAGIISSAALPSQLSGV